jgi:hypothetical protein
MPKKNKDEILHDHNNDGVDRRGFLKCMAWAGTGALCVTEGGILKSYSLSRPGEISKAGSPGPMKVPAEQLQSVLGITDVNYVQGRNALAVVDATLA